MLNYRRRVFLIVIGLVVSGATCAMDAARASTFGYTQVVAKAMALAASDYEQRDKVPDFLGDLNPEQFSRIDFKPEESLWHGDETPFVVRFYHPGSFFVYPVVIHEVSEDGVKTIPFSRDDFEYPDSKIREQVPSDLGFAGVKILRYLNHIGYRDEVASFLGASYFRAVPADANYGLSARGLAIDLASDHGEEFPAFTEFWLVRPAPGQETLTLYALLDSPSVTGAYRFIIDPGQVTTMTVDETLFTRKAIDKLGIAPLTSMFMWGENSLHRNNKARPEAHDSDGLLIHSDTGEWLWRPLKNPQRLTINGFRADDVRGFGLMQRDRDFSHYQHLTYQYERRPNLWVVPEGDWGKGKVELVQIPSDNEVNDNIDAYWVPEKPIEAHQTHYRAYTLVWSMRDPSPDRHALTRATRIGHAAITPQNDDKYLKVAIEFEGGKLDEFARPDAVKAHVSPERDVRLTQVAAVPNPHTGGWRLSFLVPTDALSKPLELRAYLSGTDGEALTETWSYTLTK